MTERKVLNKYFPPDFDPSKIPRLKGRKKEKIFSIRTMAPFNMMCLTCRNYIFKAKKFNSRMEESGDLFLGLKEYRFHIRCPTCCAEIIYKTDRENNDYVVESGAKRSFEAYTTAIRQAIREEAAEKEELEKNPIKALEKRTEESAKEFKMNNKIQDLLEKSRRGRSREDTIEKTLEMLRTEKMIEDEKEKEIVESLIAQAKSNQSTSSTAENDDFQFGQNGNSIQIRWKEILAKKRQKTEYTNEPKCKEVKLNESIDERTSKCKEVAAQNSTINSNNDNPLGLDYDSD